MRERELILQAMADAFIARRHGPDFAKAQEHEPQYAAYVTSDARLTMSDVLEALEKVADVTFKDSAKG